jgi:sulfur carrier protein ThiS
MPSSNHITVRVGKLPGQIAEWGVPEDSTAADALRIAGLDIAGYQVQINGESADLTDTLDEGDSVFLLKKIKGN